VIEITRFDFGVHFGTGPQRSNGIAHSINAARLKIALLSSVGFDEEFEKTPELPPGCGVRCRTRYILMFVLVPGIPGSPICFQGSKSTDSELTLIFQSYPIPGLHYRAIKFTSLSGMTFRNTILQKACRLIGGL
jgi:hypothetical protein